MEGGREMQEGGDMGTYVYVQLIHFVIQQKLTHHCKALILQKDVKKTPQNCRTSHETVRKAVCLINASQSHGEEDNREQ